MILVTTIGSTFAEAIFQKKLSSTVVALLDGRFLYYAPMSFQEPLQVWKIDGNDVDDGNVGDSDSFTETFKMTRVLGIQPFSMPVRSWLEWSGRNHPR